MRTLNPSLALASLVGFLTAASCTLITDVDRTKIPPDAGTAEGGSGGTGGTTGGTGGTGGDAGDGSGGTGGSKGGAGGTAGTGGTGPLTPVCQAATGKITVGVGTLIADGDTFTLGDGINPKVVFEFDLASGGVTDGNVAVDFDGTEDNASLAALIAAKINAQSLHVMAAVASAVVTGGAGAGGESGASGATNGGAGNGGAPNGGAPNGGTTNAGGEGGGVIAPPPDAAVITLTNDLAGALGNVKITKTVGNPNFTVSGMSGGKSVACDQPSSCKSDAECDSLRTCGADSICE